MPQRTLVKLPVLLYISGLLMLFAVGPVRNYSRAVKRCLVFGVLLSLFCLSLAFPAWAQKEDWLPITQQNLQIKEVPGHPAASAIQLYYSDLIDDSIHSEFIYRRIKILTDKGKEQADVEIPAGTGLSIKELRALLVNGMFFDTNKYSELKDFFNKVQAGDEQQAVLHVGGANSASKGN